LLLRGVQSKRGGERIDHVHGNVERRIRSARFPQTKSFDIFDFAAQPSTPWRSMWKWTGFVPVCAENLIRVGGVRESAILAA
jgi:DNA replication protein DnaC